MIRAFFFAALALFAAPALAADTTVTVPFGDYIAFAADLVSKYAAPLVAIILGIAARVLPAAIVDYLAMLRIEQLLTRAVGYGITAVKGAAEGQTLTVNVGNEVLAQALNYAIKHAPDVVTWAGGADALREKILARLNVAAGASVAKSIAGDNASLSAL